jgi:hypothetical protein
MFPGFGPVGGLAMNQPATMMLPVLFRRASTVAGPVKTLFSKMQPLLLWIWGFAKQRAVSHCPRNAFGANTGR